MVYIILGKGFEEAEALIPCDLLRRAGVEVCFAGIGGREITGGHGITICADCIAEEAPLQDAEMLVLPGGLGGVASILGCEAVMEALPVVYAKGNYVAAICAAPTILAKLGITDGKWATCYPGMEDQMGNAKMSQLVASRDGNVITGRSVGTAFEFAHELIAALCGGEMARKVAHEIVFN